MEGCAGDLRELRPTLFAGVPMVYDKIKSGILRKVKQESQTKQLMFEAALKLKKKAWKHNIPTHALDNLIFDKFKESLGGRVRFMVSGGAPLSPDAHLFLSACFGIPLLQGYGLTETCGAGTAMMVDDHSQGTCGPPIPCTG